MESINMEIKTIVESTDDIELLRSMCIERGSMILELNDKIDKLEDELEITNEDLRSCYASNY
jgi:hypothetical protein